MEFPFVTEDIDAVVNYRDLEDFLKEEYGLEFDIQAQAYSNDSYFEISARWVPNDEEYAGVKKDLDELFEFGGPIVNPDTQLIFADLVYRDKVPPARYLVTIWW